MKKFTIIHNFTAVASIEVIAETREEAAKYVSEIVGHEVEASVKAVSQALDDYVEEHEEEEPDLFYSFHEFTVLS